MKRILIVDDSATARMFIRRCLEMMNYPELEIVEAGNGKEALALLKENPAQLVVADFNMPLMDGETLLRWIKSNPKLHYIPVIFVTSANNSARAQKLTELGAQAILSKPVSPAALSQALEGLTFGAD